MKTTKLYVTGLLTAASLALACISSHAQPAYATNLVAYNFNTNQVTGIWSIGVGSVQWDPTTDASNNPASGSMKVALTFNGSSQYILMDNPWYSPVNLTIFTNVSWDMRYAPGSAIRTNSTAAGVNGSLGPGSLDFGFMRIGSRGPAFSQDWYQYFAISATNGAGLPNTNWIHMSVDISHLAQNFSDLNGGLINFLIGMDGSAYGNNGLVGAQTMWYDNFTFNGYVAPLQPTLTILKTTPALRLFGGAGIYARSQLTLVDTNQGWIGGTYPVTYSFTLLDNATSAAPVDYHIHIIQDTDGYSGADFTDPNVLWLQIISGSGTNTSCIANVAWKTNTPNANPNQTAGGGVALQITNPVLAGTWTLTFNSKTNGTLTAPGAGAVPFTLALSDADATACFTDPVQVRFGLQNNGNSANNGVPHDWANISVSGTAGTHVNENFTTEGTNQLDTTVWNRNASDGAGLINLVPTNAPYWILWTTPDTGFTLETATNLTGPWRLPEYYNNYADGTNQLATGSPHAGQQWNLMLPQYLPTADGAPGGPLSPTAYFRLTTSAPPLY